MKTSIFKSRSYNYYVMCSVLHCNWFKYCHPKKSFVFKFHLFSSRFFEQLYYLMCLLNVFSYCLFYYCVTLKTRCPLLLHMPGGSTKDNKVIRDVSSSMLGYLISKFLFILEFRVLVEIFFRFPLNYSTEPFWILIHVRISWSCRCV